MQKICFTIFILCSSFLVKAQGPHLNLTGDAQEVDGKFYEIDLVKGANKTGGAWYPQSFNLDSSFSIDTYVNFGNFGAEGFAINLNNDSIPTGTGAEQLGVPTTGNSFIVEFDLQQNAITTDANVPHASFFKNGSLVHQGTDLLQNGTIAQQLNKNEGIRIDWNAQSQTFTIKRLGCSNSDLNYIGDIKNTIFGGNPKVFIGYTAATSTIADTVSLLLHYNSEGISKDQTICQGEEISLHAYNGISTNWSSNEPYTANLSEEELMLHGVAYEILAKPINSAYYIASHLDFCESNKDSIWVEVLDTLSISTEVIKVAGQSTADILLTIEEEWVPYSIEWVLPDLTKRSDQDLMDVPFGLYQVTVTGNNQCSSSLEIELKPDQIIAPEPDPAVSEQDYFSPNGDGEDDFIKINVKGESQVVDFQGRILKTVNYGDLWDGTSENGKLVQSGVYIVIGENDKQVITILR